MNFEKVAMLLTILAVSQTAGTDKQNGLPAFMPSSAEAERAGASKLSLSAEQAYPRLVVGRTIVVALVYSNKTSFPWPLSLPSADRLGDGVGGLAAHVRAENWERLCDRKDGDFDTKPILLSANASTNVEVELPLSLTPPQPGPCTLNLSYRWGGMVGTTFQNVVTSSPLRFEVLSAGTPTPERPRPWKEYTLSNFAEFRPFLVSAPMHRVENMSLVPAVRLEAFCDSGIAKEKRMAMFDRLIWAPRPYNAKLLPLALDEKTDEDIRLRALMLLGGMEKNEEARRELIEHYWRKDDAGKPSALYRLAFLYGGGGESPISYGHVDPSPLVRAFGLWSAGRHYRGEECIQIARTLTNAVEKMPIDLFPDLRRSFEHKDIGNYARDSIAGWERMFREPWPSDRPKPVPPPVDAAEQAEAVRKLFH